MNLSEASFGRRRLLPQVPPRRTESEGQLSRQGSDPCWPKPQRRTFLGKLLGRTDPLDLPPRCPGTQIECRTWRQTPTLRQRKERIARAVRIALMRTAVSGLLCEMVSQTDTPRG